MDPEPSSPRWNSHGDDKAHCISGLTAAAAVAALASRMNMAPCSARAARGRQRRGWASTRRGARSCALARPQPSKQDWRGRILRCCMRGSVLPVSGAGAPKRRSRRSTHPFASVRFISDGLAACLGAHGGADGAIVVAGTGSIGVGLIGGRELRFGGYGFPISDEGSGADIGLQAIRLALARSR